ncbi:MAG: hypothetical protein WCA20_00845 [Candidatus Sulfotelmatobacter sp.]
MKAIAASILALGVLVALVPAAHAAEHCTAAMVKGHYGFTFSGFTQDANGNNLPLAGTGRRRVTGKGISRPPSTHLSIGVSRPPYTGTVINPDCSGSVTSTNGNANFSTVVVRGGAEIFGVATNPGETWTIDLKRID